MSWASHNPEKYNELTRHGIVQCIINRLIHFGYNPSDEMEIGFDGLVDMIQNEPELRGLYIELQRLASVDILKTEQDYFGGLADQARNKYD